MSGFTVPKGYALTGHCDLTYENSGRFLKDYCGNCSTSRNCRIQEGMRLAMGNNHPYAHESLTIARRAFTFPEEWATEDDPAKRRALGENLELEEIVICAEYADRQLEFKFAANQ